MRFNLDNFFLVIGRDAADEMRVLLERPSVEVESMRRFLLPAIRDSEIVSDTDERHFLLNCLIKNHAGHKRIFLMCAYRKGAPSHDTEYTLHVYSALSYVAGSALQRRRVELGQIRQHIHETLSAALPTEEAAERYSVSDDGCVYAGKVYKWKDMNRPDLVNLIDAIKVEVAGDKAAYSHALTTGILDRESLAAKSVELLRKGQIIQCIQNQLREAPDIRRKEIPFFFMNVAAERLPPALFDELREEAKRKAKELA